MFGRLKCNRPRRGLLQAFLLALAAASAVAGVCRAQESSATGWSFSGEARARLEFLDGQFRVTSTGSDQLLALRMLLQGRYDSERFSLVGEVQDSRGYLNDEGSFVNTSVVNTFALLQAHAEFRWQGEPGGAGHTLKVGRYTIDVGSRRFMERNRFRNTINSYAGVHWRTLLSNGAEFQAFWSLPVLKRPFLRAELLDNEYERDEESTDHHSWGLYYRQPGLPWDTEGEIFLYGLDETFSLERSVLDRDVLTAGLRWLRKPALAQLDFEFEMATQFGNRSTNDPLIESSQDVQAEMLHLEAGYTFGSNWRPRLSVKFDYASGDKPGGHFDRYENFFGTRRKDFGNTGIYGPFVRTNIIAPGIRLGFDNGRTSGQVLIQHLRLAEASDAWLAAGLRSPSGEAGSELGTTMDVAVAHWLVDNRLRLELGGSIFSFGDFPRNVSGGPEGSRTLYGFAQVEFFF